MSVGFIMQAISQNSVDGCILLTEEQIDFMIQRELQQQTGRRKKRQFIDFSEYPVNKWSNMPIIYKFDGTHCE